MNNTNLNMETLVTISDFLILSLIISLPILLLIFLKRKSPKRIAVKFFLIGFFSMALLISIYAAWSDISNLMLLKHYGYNADSMNYDNVSSENRERVKNLVTSIMGIGWPLKAIFGFIMTIPYLIFVYIGKIMIGRLKNNKE
jgi:hypothetical protein